MATTTKKTLREINISGTDFHTEAISTSLDDKKSISRLRIAIIGSGVSGFAALWGLKSTQHEIHLYESQDYFGGHTQTVEWRNLHGEGTTNVGIAFALFNCLTYPNFAAFVKHLKLPAHPLRVTFGLSRDSGSLEWSSRSICTLFSQRQNFFSPTFYRMLFDVLRFNHRACLVLSPSYAYPSDSIFDYLNQNQYSLAFQNGYLIPLVSSLWVHDPDQTLNSIPMVMLIRYLHNHRILNSFGKSLEWLVLEQGAKQYVDAILADIPSERLHKSTPIINVSSSEGGKLALRLENRNVEYFDRFMPRNRKAWCAYNYHDFTSSKLSPSRVSLTANLNTIPSHDILLTGPIFTTLNPIHLPSLSTIQGIYHHKHPIFDHQAQTAQAEMGKLQGKRDIWLAGAWLGYGFHEDGFRSGIEAARAIEPRIKLLFRIVDWNNRGLCKR
ncbi:uncharacterized protein K444DRAFT_643379 [Hyaloscypha bicolor E]|uniref:FAD/NAD(P)-binding domain-containing protein n=1 Tax=Hyaloscypha bicolor E TaxID=1095630 RepID=A0A2J6T9F7_9HELO|nr:uncharacterized protein K444DRAFT_643379 [Hyaloscypha bicolor E]PMD59603.1 hypothetical protein K444DRAFT_643379 [Hyaloscypha bicolor E]